MNPGTPALGAAVRHRRTQLGISIREAATEASIARRTWAEVETGQRLHVRIHTLNAMDRVLQQRVGTLAALLERQEDVERRITVEYRTREGSTDEDLLAREQLARLSATLSTTNVYRVLAYIDRLPDARLTESVMREAARKMVDARLGGDESPTHNPKTRKAG